MSRKEVISLSSNLSEDNENDIKMEYDKTKEGRSRILLDLCKVVSGLNAPGTFACGGQLNLFLPGLHITGFGDVGLPLRESEAKNLIALCQRAPFGRGSKTIVDTTVRNTWQLSPSEVQLKNKDFVKQIDSLVKNTVAVKLGLGPSANVAAHLYKLLLYEPGGFFVPHKDTEKEKGMFASLVITLPSTFEGGELVVTHQGMEKTFKPENPSFTTSYVSFFADCKHEIKPVTSGYRLALVYNVVSLDKGPLPGPSANNVTTRAAECIERWKKSTSGPSKAVFVLQHEYTPSGLAVNVLKNKDRAMAQVLQEATKGEDFDMYLALLNYTKSGPAECVGHYRNEAYSLMEVHSENIRLQSLVNVNGERTDITIPVTAGDIYPPGIFDDDEADSESVEEATGNEGASIELRYHRAVIIIWPKNKWIDIICDGKPGDAVKYLFEWITKYAQAHGSKDSAEKKSITKMTEKMVGRVDLNSTFLECLRWHSDVKLLQKYIQSVKAHWETPEFGSFRRVLDKCLTKFGWAAIAPSLIKFSQKSTLDAGLSLLTHLTAFKSDDKDAQGTLHTMASDLITVKFPSEKHYANNVEKVCSMAKIASVVDPVLLKNIFKHIETHFKEVDTELIPALTKLHELVPSMVEREEFVKLAKQAIAVLEKRIAAAQPRADDWSVLIDIKCNCNECKPVAAFLRSPTETEYRYKAGLHKRVHIEDNFGRYNKIEAQFKGIIKTTTDKNKSPQTLVVTKVGKEVDFARKKAKRDQRTVNALNKLMNIAAAPASGRATKRQKVTHAKK